MSLDGLELRDMDVVDGRLLLCCDFLLVNSSVLCIKLVEKYNWRPESLCNICQRCLRLQLTFTPYTENNSIIILNIIKLLN